MKTYTAKSNARRAAVTELSKALSITKDEVKAQEGSLFTVEPHEDGGFYWRRVQDASSHKAPVHPNTEEPDQLENDNQVEMGYTKAGDCVPAEDVEYVDAYGTAYCPHCNTHLSNGHQSHLSEPNQIHEKYEFLCLACGEEFGPEIKAKKAPAKTGKAQPRVSTVESPCKTVWDIADSMKDSGAKRKDVIQACVDAGVAFYTARTQYQQWLVATCGETK